jgi:hypothetical protein
LTSTTRDPDREIGYLGIRAGLSKPVDATHRDGVLGTLTVGAGIEVPLSRSLHCYVEIGPTVALYRDPRLIPSTIGIYGLLGFGIKLGH